MSTKTISLSEDAYYKLKKLKKGKESFSDVVRKLTGNRSLLEIAGVWEDTELEKNIKETRARTKEDVDQIAKSLQ